MSKLKNIISYLRFWLTATNEHGVHSPFVFRFLTCCLYTRTEHKGTTCLRIAHKIIPYFGIRSIYLGSHNHPLRQLISANTPEVVFDKAPYDLIYSEAADVETLHLIARDVLRVHEYTIIMVGGIYNNRDTVRHWNTLKLSARFRVSIDLYHCGLLFIRTGQAAQHFKIRI